jgi:hypothetical protein
VRCAFVAVARQLIRPGGLLLQAGDVIAINIACEMSDRDSDFTNSRAQGFARLAVLQRLRDQAKAGHRDAMLQSIDKLIEQETRALREHDPEHDDNERLF